MEVKQINQLMVAMGRTGIKKLVFKKEGIELELEREEKTPFRSFDGQIETMEENPMRSEIEKHRFTGTMTNIEGDTKIEIGKPAIEEDVTSVYVTSPMVGTLYYSPSPNDPVFAKVGDRVEKNTVVCIIEAMKVMNEVKAGVSGTINAILVKNGDPVEFGTKLFSITP